MSIKSLFVTLFLYLCAAGFCQAQDGKSAAIGTWKSIDDNTGEARSYVDLFVKGDKLFGKISKLLDANADPSAVCDQCKSDDPRYKKPILGLEIIQDLAWSERKDVWQSGKVLDPENGKEYTCKIWVTDDGLLKLRGYIGPLYRTQTWHPVK